MDTSSSIMLKLTQTCLDKDGQKKDMEVGHSQPEDLVVEAKYGEVQTYTQGGREIT